MDVLADRPDRHTVRVMQKIRFVLVQRACTVAPRPPQVTLETARMQIPARDAPRAAFPRQKAGERAAAPGNTNIEDSQTAFGDPVGKPFGQGSGEGRVGFDYDDVAPFGQVEFRIGPVMRSDIVDQRGIRVAKSLVQTPFAIRSALERAGSVRQRGAGSSDTGAARGPATQDARRRRLVQEAPKTPIRKARPSNPATAALSRQGVRTPVCCSTRRGSTASTTAGPAPTANRTDRVPM